MKNIIKANGLRSQLETFASMPNLHPDMRNFLEAGVTLIDHVFTDKYSLYENNWEANHQIERVLDKAQKLVDAMVRMREIENGLLLEDED